MKTLKIKPWKWKFQGIICLMIASCIAVFIIRNHPSISEVRQDLSSPRIFIFTSDNRPLLNNQDGFHKLGALINFAYARRYQYTYRYFQISYNDSRKIAKNTPIRPMCFNEVLKQERSVHWSKLQVIWYVAQTYSFSHDLFMYIDSDAVINNHSISLTTMISNLSWVLPSKCKKFTENSCHMALFYDTWKKSDTFVVPNSGIFLFRPTSAFYQLMQLWWHSNVHESNFFGFYEQDSLWNLLENLPSPAAPKPSTQELENRKVWNSKIKAIFHRYKLFDRLGIIDMVTFGNSNAAQFIVHMTSGLGTNHREPELRKVLQRVKGSLNESDLLRELQTQCIVQFDATNDRIPWTYSK